jgi:MraZ protein
MEFVALKGRGKEQNEKCIFLYSYPAWEKVEAQLGELPTSQSNMRAYVRTVMASVRECEMNQLGRASLPSDLRAYAGLSKDVVIIGALHKVEIWDIERWAEYNGQLEDSGRFEEVSEAVNIKF